MLVFLKPRRRLEIADKSKVRDVVEVEDDSPDKRFKRLERRDAYHLFLPIRRETRATLITWLAAVDSNFDEREVCGIARNSHLACRYSEGQCHHTRHDESAM